MARGRGRERELSEEELNQLKDDVRYLLGEGGWNRQALNRALGFAEKSGSVTNLLYDKTGRVSTTRERYGAVRQIREEGIEPGAVLVEGRPQRRPRKGAKRGRGEAATASGRGRRRAPAAVSAGDAPTAGAAGAAEKAPGGRGGRRRRGAAAATESGAETGAEVQTADAAPGGSSRVEFTLGETTVRAEQQGDGRWRLEIQAVCSSEQMVAWTHRLLTDQLQ